MGDKKRKRESAGGGKAADDEPGTSGRGETAGVTVGQQTSYIKNKLVRSEKYAKLKSKAKVRAGRLCTIAWRR
jgi:hypothetical protein